MTPAAAGLAVTERLARAALRLYPRAFRAGYASDFVDVATDRWRREHAATRSALVATARACLILCADTASATPRLWRERSTPAGAGGPEPSRWGRGWTGLGGDLRIAARAIRRQPGAAVLVAGTLGLGLGLGAATFDALDRVVLRPIPGPNGDRLAHVALKQPERGWQFAPPIDIVDRWRQGAKTIEGIEVYQKESVVGRGPHGPAMVDVISMSAGLPSMLGARPLAGRILGPPDADPGAPPAVMITEAHWRDAYASDPALVGQTVRLGDETAAIVGVWPDAARFAYQGMPEFLRVSAPEPARDAWTIVIVQRARGVTDTQVEAELTPFLAGAEGLPSGIVAAITPAYGFILTAYVTSLWLVFGAGLTLMVVAIVNAANVLLGRASARAGELGIRLAIGGSTPRLMRLFLAESIALTAMGLAIATAVAVAAGRLGAAYAPASLPLVTAGGWPALRALAVAGAGAVLACVVCAAVPTWRLRSLDVRGVLAGTSGGRSVDSSSRLRQGLVSVQAAMAVLLAVGAALMLRSFVNLSSVDPGVDVDRLALVEVEAPASVEDPALAAFQSRVYDAFASIPGVQQLTRASSSLFRASLMGGVPYLEGDTPPPANVGLRSFATRQTAPPGYFETLGIPIVAGRAFAPGDPNDVVIVNESFARRSGGRVVGRVLRFGEKGSARIVGVVGDVRQIGLTDSVGRAQIYGPGANDGRFVWYVFRVSGSPDAVLPLARARLAEIDRDLPVRSAVTGRELFTRQTAQHRFVAWLLASLASLGVFFAVTGVYGVVSLEVSRRTREVGLRMALGASSARVAREVVARALIPVLAGGVAGVLASLWAGPYLEGLLFQVPPRDAWSTVAGITLLATAATGAALIPARRASRVDPAVTLRA